MNRTIFWIRAAEGLHVAVILGIWVTVGYAVSGISAKQDFILDLSKLRNSLVTHLF